MLMDRAGRTDIREEQQLFLDARGALRGERANLMAEFEQKLRKLIDERISGKEDVKADFSKVDANKLTLVDTSSMDESVITGNIIRVVENLCHDELMSFNRGVGHLLGKPDLSTEANPLAPATIVDAFTAALKGVKTENRIKFQILKELNQAPLSEINSIYADLNRHLQNMQVMPGAGRPSIVNKGMPGERRRADGAKAESAGAMPPPPPPEFDVMAMFRRMAQGGMIRAQAPQAPQFSQAPFPGSAPAFAPGELPTIEMPSFGSAASAQAMHTFAPLAPTPSGYIPGAPIISSPALHEGLTRLQAGQTGFDIEGAQITFSGIPQGLHNVLRDLQESPLGQKANQIESMTIEMVAMLFDFIFET